MERKRTPRSSPVGEERPRRGRSMRRSDSSRHPARRRTQRQALADAVDPRAGWLRRRGSTTWIEPEPKGRILFVRDGSADGIDTGDAVRFSMTRSRSAIVAAEGTVVESLGSSDGDAAVMKMAVANLGLPDEFPDLALSQAREFADVDAEAVLASGGRRDLRRQTHVTIDGEDARDFDDAVSACPEGDGFRVWISIADVASYVPARGALDREARVRGTSVYLPTAVLPMLPERLSNDLCSLRPGEPRRTLTCEMLVDGKGVRSAVEVYASLICSASRLTYTQVQRLMDGDRDAVPGPAASIVEHAVSAAALLRKRRLRNGSLDLELAEASVVVDGDGAPTTVVPRRPLAAHGVIEDLMIAANESVAEYLLKNKLVGLYRVHPPPAREKWERLQRWGERFRLLLRLDDCSNPKNLADFLRRLKETPQAEAGQYLLLRSLNQAYYSPQVALHFGLASSAYAHFTSPIRRYPDLLVHRALTNHWRGRSKLRGLDAVAQQSSEAERRAMAAEREIVHLAACLVARRHLGEEMAARVVSVHRAGLFVRPDELYADGLIPLGSLGRSAGEHMEVWEEAQIIVGRRSGRRYALGDAIKVRLTDVDVGLRRINFEVVEKPDTKSASAARKSSEPRALTVKKSTKVRSVKPKKGQRSGRKNKPRRRR